MKREELALVVPAHRTLEEQLRLVEEALLFERWRLEGFDKALVEPDARVQATAFCLVCDAHLDVPRDELRRHARTHARHRGWLVERRQRENEKRFAGQSRLRARERRLERAVLGE